MTYEEIDAEYERLISELNSPLPPECKAISIARMQHDAGLAVQSRCAHCGGLLKVTEINLGAQGTAPLIACQCGRSKNLWKLRH